MKTSLYCLLASAVILCSCHESLEKRAQREAREYTERYCPTPVQNYLRTDSVVFDTDNKVYNYYCSVDGELDDERTFALNSNNITGAFLQTLKENTAFRAYKDAGFSFAWTLRSGKNPKVVYLKKIYTAKDYK